ncbi:tetratricopeptide repeat protein [Streptomyces sp. JV178]|uniref:ATP-binding protein n=1 Tax=Streptomyces sp. JV178 TaxID=858632 RepID=UPI00267AD37C|nr:XRE family transcriptional regulator [Streptomyces sp. JV178]
MFGELLRDHRRRRGLTQEELADRAGVSVRTISHVETGRIDRPRPGTVRRLADALALTGGPREEFQDAATGLTGARTEPPAPPRLPWGHPAERPVPAQLPPALPGFAGRVEQLDHLDALLDTSPAADGTTRATGAVVISAIAGTAGVGKTALAVHWAWRMADRFPDGQLYVNLRGFHPTASAMSPTEAIRGFLTAFAVPTDRVDRDPDAQIGLYRSLFAGRRVLVVLDNARDAEQVRPLLPATPGCLALVTSRNRLTGLVAADGAHPLLLDLLTEDEARQLLVGRLGRDRVADAPDATREIITRCARLPLALSIVAARAATAPGLPLASFARELREAGSGPLGHRLDAFAEDDPATDVRTVFSWSYRRVTPPAARLFRLLGLHTGPDITAPAAAALAGVPHDEARTLLGELTRAHLLEQHRPGRYTSHDLLRAYAAELTGELDAADDRRAALRGLLDHQLHSAVSASDALSWYRDPVALAAPDAAARPETFTDPAAALTWFTSELPNLTAAVRAAARHGRKTHAWQLAWAMVSFFDLAGHWQEWVDTHQVALRAARRTGDTVGEARTHRNLGRVRARQGRFDDALGHLGRSLSLFRELGDPVGRAQTLRNLGVVLGRQGRHRECLEPAREALELLRRAGHRVGEGRVLNQIGWQLALIGDHQGAVEHCREALRILRGLGDRDGEGAAWDSLGHAHLGLGDHREAISCFRAALRLRHERGDLAEVADTLCHIAETHWSARDHRTAVLLWQRALAVLDRLDHVDAHRIRARLRETTAGPVAAPS